LLGEQAPQLGIILAAVVMIRELVREFSSTC
jgi:hypothetical protein